MRGPTLLGVVWLAALPILPPVVAGWSLPLVAGLLGTLPLAVWSSRTSWGLAAHRVGLLVTPEEGAPAPILRSFRRAVPGGVDAGDVRQVAGARLLHLAASTGETP